MNRAVDPVLEEFAFVHDIHPRYEDLDIQGHVNNISVHAFHAEGTRRFLLQCAGDASAGESDIPEPDWLSAQFLRVAHYPQAVQCGVRVLSVQDSRVLLQSALFQQGACLGAQLQTLPFSNGPGSANAQVVPPDTLQSRLAHLAPDLQTSFPDEEPMLAPDSVSWPHQAFMTARFGDIDARGATGSLALLRFAEQARVPVLYAAARHAGVDLDVGPVDALLAHTRIRYFDRRAVYGRVELSVRPLRLGTTSVVLQSAVHAGQVCLAVNESVLVFVQRASLRPMPMVPGVRAYFSMVP